MVGGISSYRTLSLASQPLKAPNITLKNQRVSEQARQALKTEPDQVISTHRFHAQALNQELKALFKEQAHQDAALSKNSSTTFKSVHFQDQKPIDQTASLLSPQLDQKLKQNFIKRTILKILTWVQSFFIVDRAAIKIPVLLDTQMARSSLLQESTARARRFTRVVRLQAGVKVSPQTLKNQFPSKQEMQANFKQIVQQFGLTGAQAASLKKILHKDTTTAEEIHKFLAQCKQGGLFIEEAGKALVFNLRYALENGIGKTEQEIHALNTLYEMEKTNLQKFPLLKYLETSKTSLGTNFFAKLAVKPIVRTMIEEVEKRADQDIGAIFATGWPGHAVAMEIKKEGSQYILSVANTGSGALAKGEDCQAVRVYYLDGSSPEKLAELLTKIESLEVNYSYNSDNQAQVQKANEANLPSKFYHLLEKHCNEDKTISKFYSSRPYQEADNCTLRSPQELYYFILQRNGMTDLANRLQDSILAQAKGDAADTYPLLQELVNSSSPRRPLESPKF